MPRIMTPHFNDGGHSRQAPVGHSRQAQRRPAPSGRRFPVSTPYQTIRLARAAAGAATLTLTRPEAMNAGNGRMAEEVERALRACEADDAVRAVVITGAGRAFCAGADLSGAGA